MGLQEAQSSPRVPNLQLMRRRDALPGFLSRDIIDQEIQQLCEKWPAILEDNTIIRKAQGRYRINGREVTVSLRMREATREEEECVSKTPSLDEAKAADGQVMDLSGDLIVRDGPLKQPFLDYVFDTGQKEYYSMAEPDKLENKSVDTPKPLAPDLKGGQLAVQDDRLEAMEIAWTSSDADSLSELPQMPLPPPLPKSSEPVQHAAGIHLTKTCQETSQLCRTYDAEACLVEIVMDMPIAPAGSFPVCHAMFCTPQACAVASPNSPVVMGFAAAKELWRLMVPRFRHVTTEEEAEIVENVTRDDVFCQVGGGPRISEETEKALDEEHFRPGLGAAASGTGSPIRPRPRGVGGTGVARHGYGEVPKLAQEKQDGGPRKRQLLELAGETTGLRKMYLDMRSLIETNRGKIPAILLPEPPGIASNHAKKAFGPEKGPPSSEKFEADSIEGKIVRFKRILGEMRNMAEPGSCRGPAPGPGLEQGPWGLEPAGLCGYPPAPDQAYEGTFLGDGKLYAVRSDIPLMEATSEGARPRETRRRLVYREMGSFLAINHFLSRTPAVVMELPQSLVHELPKHWTSATQGPATGHANEGKGPFHLDPRRRAGGCPQTSAITFLAKHISASLSLWEPLAPTRSGEYGIRLNHSGEGWLSMDPTCPDKSSVFWIHYNVVEDRRAPSHHYLLSDDHANIYFLLNSKAKKMPSAAILMELMLLLNRGLNQWADELAHPDCQGFAPGHRLRVNRLLRGPHGDSSTKPCVELQETDVPGGPVKPSELVMRNSWPQDGAVQLLPLLPAVSDFRGNGPAKVKRRHKYGEVILPGELTFGFGHASKMDQAQVWPDRPLREAPTKQAPAALALDELHLAEL
ncbi:unnamed protein product [Symbiodinium necroappetens]|uniref:Uncharacterized protein n=1 Tax=Symbiodinium necroappetens TaxID=1628268 RepID=A0A812XLM9_9DINO|nr:unnamed protein product [Symbiodinium necroappetens]